MPSPQPTHNDLEASPRFQKPRERRDFLGLASLWSAGIALGVGLLGALRLPIPWAFPEAGSRAKLGPLKTFQDIDAIAMPDDELWLFSDKQGLYAISTICTHLGCIVARQATGEFFCPCHGSRFDAEGNVISGPAPRHLDYLKLFVSPDGQLVVDRAVHVSPEERLAV